VLLGACDIPQNGRHLGFLAKLEIIKRAEIERKLMLGM